MNLHNYDFNHVSRVSQSLRFYNSIVYAATKQLIISKLLATTGVSLIKGYPNDEYH